MSTRSLGPVTTPTGTERSGNVLRDAWVATGGGRSRSAVRVRDVLLPGGHTRGIRPVLRLGRVTTGFAPVH